MSPFAGTSYGSRADRRVDGKLGEPETVAEPPFPGTIARDNGSKPVNQQAEKFRYRFSPPQTKVELLRVG
jgi:hypothetical protein